MSLYKAILHGKERRESYRGSKSVDASCRPHGGGHRNPCERCERDRLWHAYRERTEAEEQLRLAADMIQDERDLAREAGENVAAGQHQDIPPG